jgi:hypothetical protein
MERYKNTKKETNKVLRCEKRLAEKKRLRKLKKIKITPEDSLAKLPTLNRDINRRLGS